MSSSNSSDSENQEKGFDSGPEEVETPINGATQKISEYEKQRMKRIEENRARMEAMGLHKMASSLIGSVQIDKKKRDPKGKRKMAEEDAEYNPSEEERYLSSSSEGDDDDDAIDSGYRIKKAKKKKLTPSKKVPVQKFPSTSDFVDDELMQAIALSLQDSAGLLDIGKSGSSKSSHANVKDGDLNEGKQKAHIQEDIGKRKRKKSINSRVQMTEDELILHFFQLDEVGKGGITLRDLRRVAAAHDFTWSDKEMEDMIYIFDSDGDGKLSLEDFFKIAGRCNMVQQYETAAKG